MKKLCLLIAMIMLLAFTSVCYAANWQQVTTFTGSAGQTTDYFNIPTTEWRIVWTITPENEYGSFYTFIYSKGNALYVDSFDADTEQTTGTIYIHEGNKDYYLKMGAANLESYTLKIEYDTAAPIPEYSTIAIITALIAISGMVILVKQKGLKQPKQE